MIYISPLKVLASKVKSWILNLNQYRNTYFRTLNAVKINYKEQMQSQIAIGPGYNKVASIYTVYPGNKRLFDLGNVCCIHQKFFEDALVETGKLPDDNYTNIPLTVYVFGGIDTANPRVEVELVDLEKEGVEKVIEILYNVYERNKKEEQL